MKKPYSILVSVSMLAVFSALTPAKADALLASDPEPLTVLPVPTDSDPMFVSADLPAKLVPLKMTVLGRTGASVAVTVNLVVKINGVQINNATITPVDANDEAAQGYRIEVPDVNCRRANTVVIEATSKNDATMKGSKTIEMALYPASTMEMVRPATTISLVKTLPIKMPDKKDPIAPKNPIVPME